MTIFDKEFQIRIRPEMKTINNFTVILEKEDDDYAALCPELDIASQAGTVEESKKIYRKLSNYSSNTLETKKLTIA